MSLEQPGAHLRKRWETEKIGTRIASRQFLLLLISHERGVYVFLPTYSLYLSFRRAMPHKDHFWHLRPRRQVCRQEGQCLEE